VGCWGSRAGEKEKERPAGKEGLGWVFPWAGLFWVWASSRVWAPFLFLFSLSFLFLIQTKFEFKTGLNSNHSQIIKTMHQHECNTKI